MVSQRPAKASNLLGCASSILAGSEVRAEELKLCQACLPGVGGVRTMGKTLIVGL